IAYFAAVGASQQEQFGKKEETTTKKVTLEDQIVQTNPVLEAFGTSLLQEMPRLCVTTTRPVSENSFEFTSPTKDESRLATSNTVGLTISWRRNGGGASSAIGRCNRTFFGIPMKLILIQKSKNVFQLKVDEFP
ncbi:hypothetical protein ANCDUO_25297, partial [Ancylostoma duodenale]